MILNKLYKGFMYVLAFLMSFVISYTIGFVAVSALNTLVTVIATLCYKPLAQYIFEHFTKIVLIASLLPCTVALISVWKRIK